MRWLVGKLNVVPLVGEASKGGNGLHGMAFVVQVNLSQKKEKKKPFKKAMGIPAKYFSASTSKLDSVGLEPEKSNLGCLLFTSSYSGGAMLHLAKICRY